ncbi:MAG TPA: hypothetical protein VJM14_13820 [Burkholderiales bacterium]|nr:hypothetical protein [Burkholderiales bacterium]
MKTQDAIFLAGESIPFGLAISAPRAMTLTFRRIAGRARKLVARDELATRIAAVGLMFGGLACLVWVVLGYAAAL